MLSIAASINKLFQDKKAKVFLHISVLLFEFYISNIKCLVSFVCVYMAFYLNIVYFCDMLCYEQLAFL
jgi:hypothetical protein